jgi:hypothetical protein
MRLWAPFFLKAVGGMERVLGWLLFGWDACAFLHMAKEGGTRDVEHLAELLDAVGGLSSSLVFGFVEGLMCALS